MMGCKASKSKKNVCARVAQYQKESWAAEEALLSTPSPFDNNEPPPGCIDPTTLHNLLTDGFYAPFVANPLYLLLIDCRDQDSFSKRRLLSAKWHGALNESQTGKPYLSVILYDGSPRSSTPTTIDKSFLGQFYNKLLEQKLNPKIVLGGWPAIEVICSHLIVDGWQDPFYGISPLTWFPTLILPGFLYLGQSDMATNPTILRSLKVTHIITLSLSVPRRILSTTNYLVIPISDDIEDDKKNSKKDEPPHLTTCYGTLIEFVSEAKAYGGSVLVHSDENLMSAAAIVMALLMRERGCTLEDAFYYVKGARSTICPKSCLLQQLVALESMIFGAALTSTEDLF